MFLDESNLHHVELLDTQTNRKQQTNIGDVLIEKGFAQHASKKAQSSILTNGEQVSRSYIRYVLTVFIVNSFFN